MVKVLMIVDSSFLVAWLYTQDAQAPRADELAQYSKLTMFSWFDASILVQLNYSKCQQVLTFDASLGQKVEELGGEWVW